MRCVRNAGALVLRSPVIQGMPRASEIQPSGLYSTASTGTTPLVVSTGLVITGKV